MAAVFEYYGSCIALCQAWAEQAGVASLDDLVAQWPRPAEPIAFDVSVIAVALAQAMDLCSEGKLLDFRLAVQGFLEQAGSKAFAGGDEPWHAKDAFHLLCELLVFTDLTNMQNEVVAVMIQSVVDFGRDAMAVMAFLLGCRAHLGMGPRAGCGEETQFLAAALGRAIGTANEYLLSEHVGSLSLLELVQHAVE